MATTGTYFFYLENDVVKGYYNELPSTDNLSTKEEFIKKVIQDDPNKYLGLTKTELESENPTFPEADPTDRDSLEYRRKELKKRYFEITFTTELGEDTTTLQAEYDALKLEYTNLRDA
ncbi:hypothetical protein NBRC110019_07320 [Neptunitalea chrysea]|uniref:Uncharacterized protein n=1 Tax=Neptunitalea chrysea TaxID=1647581 RepID=A0A9W6B382_9FLAO|nr:hypothetical protein [Neptunitalea chrysea]GLB51693.1 hypothetical protein NBRC110019_07320 [Neptunitalea chrysea]